MATARFPCAACARAPETRLQAIETVNLSTLEVHSSGQLRWLNLADGESITSAFGQREQTRLVATQIHVRLAKPGASRVVGRTSDSIACRDSEIVATWACEVISATHLFSGPRKLWSATARSALSRHAGATGFSPNPCPESPFQNDVRLEHGLTSRTRSLLHKWSFSLLMAFRICRCLDPCLVEAAPKCGRTAESSVEIAQDLADRPKSGCLVGSTPKLLELGPHLLESA